MFQSLIGILQIIGVPGTGKSLLAFQSLIGILQMKRLYQQI